MLKSIALFALATLTAFQVSAQLNAPPQPIRPKAPPAPVDPGPIEIPRAGVIRFSTLKARYDVGTPTSVEMLRGTWKAVAVASNRECATQYGEDRAAGSGLKNPDDSGQFDLLFQDEASNDPLVTLPIFGVTVSGFGSKDVIQGPYQVNPVEPQWATYAYQGNNQSTDAYYSFRCRSLDATTDRLICGLRLNLTVPADNDESVRACAATGISAFLVLKKNAAF